MARFTSFIYGVVCYLAFIASFSYAIGFVGNRVVPKSIDSGRQAPLAVAVVIDSGLLGLFAVQHSVMARQWFKRRWTKLVPEHVERSTYVLIASLTLALVYWQWRPIGVASPLWEFTSPAIVLAVRALFWLGWATSLAASFLIDHFELFGLRQVYCFLRSRAYEPPPFQATLLYKAVRHPIYLGTLVAFWSTPRMTAGHLLFAALATTYVLVAIRFEEKDLLRAHGDAYRKYRERVAMLVPLPLGRNRS